MKTGVRAILNASMVSYERLPMLDIVFDRLIRMMATSLRNFTQDNVEVSLDNIESMRFGEYIDSLTLPTLLAVFKAEEWDNYGLMSVDSSLVYSIGSTYCSAAAAAPRPCALKDVRIPPSSSILSKT